MAYVYRHRRLDKNEVFYIGIGSDDNFKRAYSKAGRNKYWHNIVNLSNYKIEIISEDWLTWEEACEKEKFWITFYGRADLGKGSLVNMTDGGEGQFNPSIETREKISNRYYPKGQDNFRYGISLKEDHKNKISKNHHNVVGENNPMYGSIGGMCGKKHKETTIDKLKILKMKKIQHVETQLIFNSQYEASIYFNISQSLVTLYKKQGKFVVID